MFILLLLSETIDGASTIYFNQVTALDSAWYQCTAQNQAGSTATRARLYIDSKDNFFFPFKNLH